jgi:hypothetical protein
MDALAKSEKPQLKTWTFQDQRFLSIFASKNAKISLS